MTVSNITQARNEIMTVLKTAWDANDESCEQPLQYGGRAQKPASTDAWARVTLLHNDGGQSSLSNEGGVRRFSYTGIVTVQVFTLIGDGLVLSDVLVQIVKDAFAGVSTIPGNVHLRNVRPREIGETGPWHQVNVITDFEYDEVR